MGNVYFSAFQKRQKGDYDDLTSFTLDEVKEDFEKMLPFIAEIERLVLTN